MNVFTKVTLYTDTDGRAKFREETIPLSEGTTAIQKSLPFVSNEYKFRHSPVGYFNDFHTTDTPIWVVILAGKMEISLQDGSSRIFEPGDCFYADDPLPPGAVFDREVHGHLSRQIGPNPLVTMFVGT